MYSCNVTLLLASVTTSLILGGDGFVPLNSNLALSRPSIGTFRAHHDHVQARSYCQRAMSVLPAMGRRGGDPNANSGVSMMAGGGSKKRRRRKDVAKPSSEGSGAASSSPEASPQHQPQQQQPQGVTAAQQGMSAGAAKQTESEGAGGEAEVEATGGASPVLGEVLDGVKSVESLFSDDWSGMPANDGMIKSKVRGQEGASTSCL